MVKTFTDSNFKAEVLEADKPVLVDFYADWCGPCKMMAPILDNLAETYDGQIIIGKLNVDENGESAIAYQVRSIPYMLVFENGKVVDSILGAVPAQTLEESLKKVL